MKKNRPPRINIRQITIRNYKGIDGLQMDFPPPRMPDDPDIFVMGSDNGLGKTSIIECCALLLLSLTLGKDPIQLYVRNSIVDIPDLLIRAGAESVEISGAVTIDNGLISDSEDELFSSLEGVAATDNKLINASITIDRYGKLNIINSIENIDYPRPANKYSDQSGEIQKLINIIFDSDPNPFVGNNILLFHSFRKVQVGNPELGMMVETELPKRGMLRRNENPMSAFKLRILRSMMGKFGLFEGTDDEESDETIKKLNELMAHFAGGEIEKLRPSPDNTVDFRVKPINPINGDATFTFDGLSSGQKEIVSTLFLIWHLTKNNPSVVFIDEPELHFNVQWHRGFINKLLNIAPQNQYILATHSEEVMDSVNQDRRALLFGK